MVISASVGPGGGGGGATFRSSNCANHNGGRVLRSSSVHILDHLEERQTLTIEDAPVRILRPERHTHEFCGIAGLRDIVFVKRTKNASTLLSPSSPPDTAMPARWRTTRSR